MNNIFIKTQVEFLRVMRSFLELKPKFGVTPFFNLDFLYLYSLYPYEFETSGKNRRTAKNRRWHFGPSQLLTPFVSTYFQKMSCGGL